MLHTFDVVMDHALAQTKELEEIAQQPVAMGNVAGQFFAGGSQYQSAVLFVFQQALVTQSLHHIGDAGLGDIEGGGDIDDPGITLGINQFEDAFEIILNRGRRSER